jgi:hypothetical protein
MNFPVMVEGGQDRGGSRCGPLERAAMPNRCFLVRPNRMREFPFFFVLLSQFTVSRHFYPQEKDDMCKHVSTLVDG